MLKKSRVILLRCCSGIVAVWGFCRIHRQSLVTSGRDECGVDPLDGTKYQQWVKRLETIFTSYMQFNPDIDQLRVIKATGEEEIRIEREEGQIAPAIDLQDKSDRSYFNNAMQLPRKKSTCRRLN